MIYLRNINIQQDVATVGVTKTNLTALQSYASSWVNANNQSALQIAVFFDRNVFVYIDQAIDSGGTEIVNTSFYPHYASQGLGRTVASIAPYYRIRLVNQANALATGDMVAVATAIFNPLPIGVDENGNLRVSSSTDGYGFEQENTPQGESRTVTPYRLVGKQFEFYGAGGLVDPSYWGTNLLNSATVTVSASSCALTSGTNSAGAASLFSLRRARYIQGNALRYRANVRLGDSGTASNTRRWGTGLMANYTFTVSVGTAVEGNVYTNNSQQFTCHYVNGATIYCNGTGAPSASGTLTFVNGPGSGNLTYTAFATSGTPTDGAWFQLVGTTFSVVTMKGGSATTVSTGSFNGTLGSTYAPTFTNNNVYEIYWTNSTVYFVIGGTLLHTATFPSGTWAQSISLACFADNINSGNTTSVTLNSRSMGIARLGPEHTDPKWTYVHGANAGAILKTGPGRLKRVVSNGGGSTCTLYDAVTSVNPITILQLSTNAITIEYDLNFYNGLFIVTVGAGTDVTVVYE